MCDQELRSSDEGSHYHEANRLGLAMLRLGSTFPSSSSSDAAAAVSPTPAVDSNRCTLCGSDGSRIHPSSAKRRSPSSSTSPGGGAAFTPESEPRPKKLLLDPSLAKSAVPGSSAAEHHHDFSGFCKILLPISLAAATGSVPAAAESRSPILRRCRSDPARPQPPSSPVSVLEPPSEIPYNNPSTSPSPARPPLHPNLRRSVSDLTPSPTPRSSGEMGLGFPLTSSDSSREGSPSFLRLKRMKERMKEMSQWWDQIMREGEEAGELEKEHGDDDGGGGSETLNISGASREEAENEGEEAVSVEKVGDGLCIHFKCPCGKGYQIFFSGSNCYYKLV